VRRKTHLTRFLRTAVLRRDGRLERKEQTVMKNLLAVSAFAALVLAGSPVMAQSVDGPQAFAQLMPQAKVVQRRGVPAIAAAHPDGRAHSSNPANDVYDTQGNYLGSDPDPIIRSSIARDENRGD
jgi:hypothetical protein